MYDLNSRELSMLRPKAQLYNPVDQAPVCYSALA